MISGRVKPLSLILVSMNNSRNSLRSILGMPSQCLAIAWSFLGMESQTRNLGMNSNSSFLKRIVYMNRH